MVITGHDFDGHTSVSIAGKVSVANMNQNIVEAHYAVRGEIVIRAMELDKHLREGAKLPFTKMVYCNIGNPQQLGQKPITFCRQVAALCDYPEVNTELRACCEPLVSL
jgi:hypothetical protein